MAQLVITMEFDNVSDIEFMRERCITALDEVCMEYARNLDTEEVMITSEIEDA